MESTYLPLALAVLSTALAAQNPWLQKAPANSPTMRRAGAMAFDGTANRLILYGGTSPTPAVILNETWSFNGTTWSLLNPAGGAAPRWGHQLVRDTAMNRLITFGGRSPTISGLANDTYRWNGSAWATLPALNAPSPRFLYGMTFDSVRNRVVMFGGRTLQGTIAETWEFDGTTWAEVFSAQTPPPRTEMAIAFDTERNRTVLFGGYDQDTDTLHGDTWEYNGTDWTPVPSAAGPEPRFRMSSIYDDVRKRMVVYGGFDGTDFTTQTLEYTGSSWNVVGGATGSTLATEMYSGLDTVRRKFVTFGGVGATFSNETWEYTGVNSPLVGEFGTACATSVGIAQVEATVPPGIGQAYTLTWSNLPLSTIAVISLHGLSNQFFSGIPLPIDLAIIGYANCGLLVSADFLGVDLTAAGTAATTFALPVDNTLVGVSLYSQILIPDDTAPNGVGGTSRGVRAIIGN